MRKSVPLLASILVAVILASVVALVVPKERAKAAFSGINGKIVFTSNRHVGNDIYTVWFNGNNLKRLTHNSPGVSNHAPSWSANGKKIVFVSNRAGDHNDDDIYIMDADGSNEKLVTNERALPGLRKEDAEPSFSPSGRKIVFRRGPDLYTIRPDGSNLTSLTSDGRPWEIGPVYSPNGAKIAFEGGNFQNWGIYVMNSDGSSPDKLVAEESAPDWSPDGAQIIYSHGSDGVGIINANGADQHVLNRGCERPSGSILWGSAAFAPGGGKIVFSNCLGRGNDYDIHTMNSDGTVVRHVTNNPARDIEPDWQPIQ